MNFTDSKIVEVEGAKFEHARIVQGLMIYALTVVLLGLGIFSSERESAILISVILSVCAIGFIIYYRFKLHSFSKGLKVGLLKMLVAPTSMIG